jgi:predicted AlkP superfamily pyrophosphatase or phosphodiesterase
MTIPVSLIMVSIDGLRAEVIDDSTLALPTMRGLIARGTRARRLLPIFPTVTWPCHTTDTLRPSPSSPPPS